MIGYTYAQLLQSLQDWPVNQGTNYIANIPRFVELGELRLVKDLNLEIFDVTNSAFTLLTGNNVITKPSELITLRTLRLALVTGTSSAVANPTALAASQATFASTTSLTFNGTLGAAPASLLVPAQVTVTDTTGGHTGGGIIVTISGLDYGGISRTEVLNTVNGATVTGVIVWSQIISMTCAQGSTPQTIEVGTAAAAQSTLGESFPVYKRSWDFVSNFAENPAVTGRPRYYAETDLNTWIVAPSADQSYAAVTRFLSRPQTIVTAGTSWLGDRCGDLLLLTSLMEAEFYLKADDRFSDLEGDYQSKLATARVEMRNQIRQGDYSPVKAAATTVQG